MTAFADNEEMVPVYDSVPDGWEAPCIWAWSAPDVDSAFADTEKEAQSLISNMKS